MAILRPTAYPIPLIGWREDVHLPDLGEAVLVAKIDTGARSAALHAENIEVKGQSVGFALDLEKGRVHFNVALAGIKKIQSSNGHCEMRPVIETRGAIGNHEFILEISLTNRTDMGVPMLLGRNAMKGHFVVHPGRSFILSRRKKKLK